MKHFARIAALAFSLSLGACSGGADGTDRRAIDVRPDQFALLPCARSIERPCTLAIAGGKRILFGTPAGVAQSMRGEDLRQLDAVMVFSLAAQDLEGLDEVRNASWHAGRSEPLRVIGPLGLEEVVTALNKAYEQADALYVVQNGIPVGGYDAAILTALTASSEQKVLDTGDLSVTRIRSGFHIEYTARGAAMLLDCRSAPRDPMQSDEASTVLTIGCDAEANDAVWPMSKPIMISEN